MWLTTTAQGLWQQPEMVPLIFAEYARSGTQFTRDAAKQEAAHDIDAALADLLGDDAGRAVWMARIGKGASPEARAVRLPLAELLLAPRGHAAP